MAQFLALRAIAAGDVGGAELARRAGISHAAVSQLVADLERACLVERGLHGLDRRRRPLALSRRGDAALAAASVLLRERLGDLLAHLPRPELDALGRLLPRVGELLGGSPPPPRPPRPEGRPRPPR